ncbi:MAG: FAD:protein FMN transferase [Candidatus Omnitrophica bacterium]|nr:FAD:protein FMN transferase [Candidatus Omnitrophota bacterium]MCM8799599.1 FAD:protein FMN transferase [Candidatus Omnitrophota bacterium]
MIQLTKEIIFVFLSFTLLSCQSQKLYHQSYVGLGTYIEITSPYKEAGKIAFEEIKKIESLLSKYDPSSEIYLLNQNAKAKLSPQTLYVIKKAKEFWEKSEGAFDITVGVLLELWGFDKHSRYRVPTDEEIRQALDYVGLDKVKIDEENRIVEIKKGMILDLGGIAKGYAVDCAVSKLKEKGINSALINIGGDIYCLGKKFGKPWRVGIKDPKTKGIRKIVELEDKAIATSGSYENYFSKDNFIYTHIFDPKKGRPVDSKIISITIVADDCLTADALATATFVLENEKRKTLVEKLSAKIEDICLR